MSARLGYSTTRGLTSRKGEGDVDDQLHARDIQPSRRNIGRNQHIHTSILQTVQRPDSRLLSEITVQTGNLVPGTLDGLFKTGCFLLVQGENEDSGRDGRVFWEGLEEVSQMAEESSSTIDGSAAIHVLLGE